MKNPGLGKSFTASAIFLFALDVYIALVPLADAPHWWIWSIIALSAAYAISIARIFLLCHRSQMSINIAIWLTLSIFFPILIFAAVSALGLLISIAWPPAFALFNSIAAILALAWLALAFFGIVWGWRRIKVDNLSVKFFDLPNCFDGYRIVHLSDFHIGTYALSPDSVSEIVDRVNDLNPDLIVFTGDLVNSASSEIDQFIPSLSRLSARDGVLSILGNHDYCLYHKYVSPDSPSLQKQRLISLERECGWNVLLNQAVTISRGNDSIAVIGVENAGGKGFPNFSDLNSAYSQVKDIHFKILLSHDPSHWRREVVHIPDIQLTLAGHTHGMQFKLGRFTPSRWGYREWGGLYQLGKHFLVVSTGVGGNVAFRFGIYPQILQITLTR